MLCKWKRMLLSCLLIVAVWATLPVPLTAHELDEKVGSVSNIERKVVLVDTGAASVVWGTKGAPLLSQTVYGIFDDRKYSVVTLDSKNVDMRNYFGLKPRQDLVLARYSKETLLDFAKQFHYDYILACTVESNHSLIAGAIMTADLTMTVKLVDAHENRFIHDRILTGHGVHRQKPYAEVDQAYYYAADKLAARFEHYIHMP